MADVPPTTPEDATGGRSRPALIIAALLYLVAAYQRTPCPCVALCIVRHLECLARHDAADPVIRQICDSIRHTWAAATPGMQPEGAPSFRSAPENGPVLVH